MIRPIRAFVRRPLTLALAALSLSVAAGEESGPIETIVVRGAYFGQALAEGVKTPTLLLNVPQSVSVMDAQQLREQAHVSVADVMQYTPGVSTMFTTTRASPNPVGVVKVSPRWIILVMAASQTCTKAVTTPE